MSTPTNPSQMVKPDDPIVSTDAVSHNVLMGHETTGENLCSAGLHDYSNSSTSSPTINDKMVSQILQNITALRPKGVLEHTIIAVLSCFVDSQYFVVMRTDDLQAPGLVPEIPPNWKSTICTVTDDRGIKRKSAFFVVRYMNQTFSVMFTYDTFTGNVTVTLNYAYRMGHLGFIFLDIRGLMDEQNKLACAQRVVGEFLNEFKHPLSKPRETCPRYASELRC